MAGYRKGDLLSNLAAVADDAAGVVFDGDFAEGVALAVEEGGDEVDELLRVGVVAGDAEGGADGAGALVGAVRVHELDEVGEVEFGAERCRRGCRDR